MSLPAEHTEEQICETSSSSCLHSSGEIGSEWFLSQCDWWRLLAAMATERTSSIGRGKLKLLEQCCPRRVYWYDRTSRAMYPFTVLSTFWHFHFRFHLLWCPFTFLFFHFLSPPWHALSLVTVSTVQSCLHVCFPNKQGLQHLTYFHIRRYINEATFFQFIGCHIDREAFRVIWG